VGGRDGRGARGPTTGIVMNPPFHQGRAAEPELGSASSPPRPGADAPGAALGRGEPAPALRDDAERAVPAGRGGGRRRALQAPPRRAAAQGPSAGRAPARPSAARRGRCGRGAEGHSG
jgi:hypothetical protein